MLNSLYKGNMRIREKPYSLVKTPNQTKWTTHRDGNSSNFDGLGFDPYPWTIFDIL
jgi:hypothetical protein